MSSTAVISMAMPVTSASHKRTAVSPSSNAIFKPLPIRSSSKPSASKTNVNLQVQASSSFQDKAAAGLAAAAMTALVVFPEVAEAAGPGVSASLKNFLLSIASGGVVLVAIIGAVVGVSNFDPVKRT
ncbi:hypothetical protein GIB67_030032 [Kingdonia uniflora]|uniref:Ultraviolet-B-repressible protein n=1 Tax=Kingdonia uniflora TaxID=39325 RepID=A0A7J7MY92_9MAGN|nr:hypothetical protein GIB67_030032 [Kingdonia uniflora]